MRRVSQCRLMPLSAAPTGTLLSHLHDWHESGLQSKLNNQTIQTVNESIPLVNYRHVSHEIISFKFSATFKLSIGQRPLKNLVSVINVKIKTVHIVLRTKI